MRSRRRYLCLTLALFLVLPTACGNGGTTTDPPALLFVQNSKGAVLTNSTLTLSGVNPQTGWFTDRPYREAGQIPTEKFVTLWAKGDDSFADNPPNADFTCTVAGEVVNYVVELNSPRLDGDELTYGVRAIGDAASSTRAGPCTGPAHLFIDNTFVAGCAGSIEEALAGAVQTCPPPGAMRM